MKKKIVVFAMLLALIVTMFAPTQNAQAASKVKAPTIQVSLNTDGVPVVSWKKVSGVTGYRVYRKTSTDTKWVKVNTTSKTKVVDTACKAKDGSTVKYTVKSYVKADGKTTWSANSKAASVKIPAKTAYTFGIEGSYYCTYLDNKVVVKDYYGIPSQYVDKNTTLKDLEDAGYVFSTYYYYDDKYTYALSGATYYYYVYKAKSDGTLEEIGVYDEISFSPNKTDRSSFLKYEDSLKEFEQFQKRFLAGEAESAY